MPPRLAYHREIGREATAPKSEVAGPKRGRKLRTAASPRCQDIGDYSLGAVLLAAANFATLDTLLEKISRMSLDLAPDNDPDVEPASIYIQINALREAIPAAA